MDCLLVHVHFEGSVHLYKKGLCHYKVAPYKFKGAPSADRALGAGPQAATRETCSRSDQLWASFGYRPHFEPVKASRLVL